MPVFMSAPAPEFAFSNLASITSAITDTISVATIIPILAGVIGASIGLVFMWWGVRKLIRILMRAFKKGKIDV